MSSFSPGLLCCIVGTVVSHQVSTVALSSVKLPVATATNTHVSGIKEKVDRASHLRQRVCVRQSELSKKNRRTTPLMSQTVKKTKYERETNMAAGKLLGEEAVWKLGP